MDYYEMMIYSPISEGCKPTYCRGYYESAEAFEKEVRNRDWFKGYTLREIKKLRFKLFFIEFYTTVIYYPPE